MIIGLQRLESEAAKPSRITQCSAEEPQGIAELVIGHQPEQTDLASRKLRNRLILANAIAWVAIIAAIRLIFF
jgi:hypothetical protein